MILGKLVHSLNLIEGDLMDTYVWYCILLHVLNQYKWNNLDAFVQSIKIEFLEKSNKI